MRFIENLKKLQSLSDIPLDQAPIYKNLFERISRADFRKLLNHVIANYDQYKDKLPHYVKKSPVGADTRASDYLHCSYEIKLQSNGQPILLIEPKSKSKQEKIDRKGLLRKRLKLKVKKPRGAYKKGCLSFALNENGISEHFTLTSQGENIKELLHEKEMISKINSPFIQQYLYGELRTHDQKTHEKIEEDSATSPDKGIKKLSISTLKLNDEFEFSNLENLLVAIKSFAYGVHHIHRAGIVHNDLKIGNLLLSPNGIVKIIDFGLSGCKGDIDSMFTPGYASPEILASLIEEERQTKPKKLNRNFYKKNNNDVHQIISELNKLKPKRSHYSSDLQKNIYYYQDAIKTLQTWIHKGEFKLGEQVKAQPTQDVWAFGETVFDFFEKYEPKDNENAFIEHLKDLIEIDILEVIPEKRLTIEKFIQELDVLILRHDPALADRINARIEKYEAEFHKSSTKSVEEKENKPDKFPASTQHREVQSYSDKIKTLPQQLSWMETKKSLAKPPSLSRSHSRAISSSALASHPREEKIKAKQRQEASPPTDLKKHSSQSASRKEATRRWGLFALSNENTRKKALLEKVKQYRAMREADMNEYTNCLNRGVSRTDKLSATQLLISYLEPRANPLDLDRFTPEQVKALTQGRLDKVYLAQYQDIIKNLLSDYTAMVTPRNR